MKNIFKILTAILAGFLFSCGHKSTTGQSISYYKVPLVCGAAPEIGCGSRIKPFFLETEKQFKIRESWANRQGTVIAIVWADDFREERQREDLIQQLFKKYDIEGELISDENEIADLNTKFKSEKWYMGMDIDQLSIEEAGVIANEMVTFAKDKSFINTRQGDSLEIQIQDYFKSELVKVRTMEELGSKETRDKWRSDIGLIVEKYIGKNKTAELSDAYIQYREEIEKTQESCCKEDKSCKDEKKDCCEKPEKSGTSEVTCPKCGHKKVEKLPTEVCQLFYKCEKCGYDMHPKDGDCCVFCSYGDHKCPSKQ